VQLYERIQRTLVTLNEHSRDVNKFVSTYHQNFCPVRDTHGIETKLSIVPSKSEEGQSRII